MSRGPLIPTFFGRLRSLQVLIEFSINPISATRRLHAANGRYVILTCPHSRPWHPQIFPFISDSALYREVTSNPEAWRSVNIGLRTFKNLAASRLLTSFTRLRGARHAHYRKKLTPLLSRTAVAGMDRDMALVAKRKIDTWPRNQATDFIPLARSLMQHFAIRFLFSNNFARALPIASMISDATPAAWPLPSRAYLKWLRIAPKLERAINEWADEATGDLTKKDIFSILVNLKDEKGEPPTKELIGGILTFTFGAAYETCQNALIWTLLLVTQHPRIAAALTDEIDQAVGDALPSMERIATLPLLDGVIKEGMRLFPPVPLHSRRSLIETEVGGVRIPAGMRVLMSAHLINRDPGLYSAPQKFMPERWQGQSRSPFENPVFGAGSRSCPGTLFANQMVKIALATILSSHRVEVAPQARIDYHATTTLAPYPSVPVILRDKKAALSRPLRIFGSIHEMVDLPAAL